MRRYFVVAHPLTLTLSQRERGFNPSSLWEKGGDGVAQGQPLALGHEGRRRFKHHAQFACDSI